MEKFPITDNTKITRLAKRGVYDVATVYSILDEALVCTVAYVNEGQPFQIPTGFARIGNTVYIHGSVGAGYMRQIAEGVPVCISTTILDGLVLARSAFHHSVNYRSVVFFSKGRKVTDDKELYECLEVFTNKMCPGRWSDVRKPNATEWKGTMAIAFELEEASAKVRTGGPKDDEEDYELDVWAGVQEVRMMRGELVADEKLKGGVEIPGYLLSSK
ncbi:MAG TPA: pyridoxamine 5'-phosphate oxidase family protein [Cyclobacteriaceae bacterium]|nr:pyridoxamine 5'-phosphate oxidase family protein [Cyclobacteriaceae bacterium]